MAAHWEVLRPGTGLGFRYRVCTVCGMVTRNCWAFKPLIHKGRKARK